MQSLTHRGLEGDDYQDASAHLIFALSLVFSRSNCQKFLESKGLKPEQSPNASLWAMAKKEATKLQ
jgi:hypothetical protein